MQLKDLWLPRELRAMLTEMSLTNRQTTYLAIRSELQQLIGRELEQREKAIVYHHLGASNVLNKEAHSARSKDESDLQDERPSLSTHNTSS